MRILITCGATREPIDGVRFITNFSTGRTGRGLAQAFSETGHEVTLLHGQGVDPLPRVTSKVFGSYSDLKTKLLQEMETGHWDAVLHLAAVSDYSVKPLSKDKIPSGEPITLHLTPNAKILPLLKGASRNPEARIVGFKLTKGADAQTAVNKIFEAGGVDLVVHNDLDQIQGQTHPFTLFEAQGPKTQGQTKTELFEVLNREVFS